MITDEIRFRVAVGSEEHIVTTCGNEYRSLMALIRDKFCDNSFGECGGMGRCATCQVQLLNAGPIPGSDRNELATLSKHGVADPSIRLSCQLLLGSYLQGCTIKVSEY